MRRAIVIIALLLVGQLAAREHVAEAQATVWPASNGLIAFRSDRDGDAEVFTVDATTGHATKVTDDVAIADLSPAWSPDGRRIAFVRRTGDRGRPDLFVVGASGRGRVRLTRTPTAERDPSWSPDGTAIVYSARTSPTGPFRLFRANADGSGRTQLTRQRRGSADRSPAVSPDGSRIAFVSDRDGGFPEIYLIGPNGRRLRRMTTNAFVEGNPTWTPDGAHLLVERCCPGGTSDLISIDVATRVATNVTDTPTVMEFDPTVSPDGSMVAYAAFERDRANLDIWAARIDGSGATRLTVAPGPDVSPDWQPVPICTVRGSPGDDADLRGTDGADVICGLGGDDAVRGRDGSDLILGGRGDDELDGQFGADVVFGDAGDDRIRGGPAYDVLDGGRGRDACVRGAQGAFRRSCER
jgi:TolB protein